ncbi:MAG: WD40 repeat domain-containing protein [Cytophagaceae bacterium]
MSHLQVSKFASLTGHKDSLYALATGLTEKEVFSSGADGMIVQWNVDNPDLGKLVAKVPNPVYALHLNSDKKLVVGQNFEGIHIIDPIAGKEEKSLKLSATAIFDIQESKGHYFIAMGDGELLKIEKDQLIITSRIKLSEKSARCIAINEKKGLLAVGYSDFQIRVFTLDELKLVNTIQAHQNSVFTLAFSPDGIYLLSGSRDARINIWETENNFSLNQSIVAHMYAVNHISFSRDGRYFASCSMDKSVKIWDAHAFKLLKVIDKARHAGHGTSVNKLLWLNYNNYIVSCSDDRTLSVWHLMQE